MSNEQNSQFNDKGVIMVVTLLSLILGFIPALIYWLVKKETLTPEYKNFVVGLLNFELTMFIVCAILAIVFAPLTGLISLLNLIIIIVATIKISKNEAYQFPLSIPIIK